jgi:hypothetical protein
VRDRTLVTSRGPQDGPRLAGVRARHARRLG